MKKMLAALAGAFAVAGCGLDGSSMGNQGTASAYDRAALQVSDTVAGYQATTATMETATACASAVQQYADQVRPMLGQIDQMAGPMDDVMRSMGRATDADVECGATVMMQELQHHFAVACTSSDMTANKAEAQRHIQAMQEFTTHMRMRADEASTMMAGAMMNGGTGMMSGGTGSNSAGGGWMMPDGQVMSWSEPMPGCKVADGGVQPVDSGSPASGT